MRDAGPAHRALPETRDGRRRAPTRPLVLALAALALLAAAGAPQPAAAQSADAPTAAAAAGSTATAGISRHRPARHRRSRRDFDGDGIPNRRDRDMDGDHVSNKRDRDIDGDRVRNKRDKDIDGDRVRNGRDREMDADRLPNSRDRDMDADRVRNCPRDRDMDADGTRNSRDRDMDADGVPNARDRDIDSDGTPNTRDSDMDCDGVPNRFDPDIDGDSIPNTRDPDSDADGIAAESTYPAGVRLPKKFFGLVAMQPFASEGISRYIQLQQVAATGARTLRQVFEWADIELTPGIYNFSVYDAYVGDAARLGFDIIPILFSPPAFRSSRPDFGANRGTYPPASNQDFAAFAAQLVRRYGPQGTFWLTHPSIPRRPITAWQVWNEPHISAYWPSGPDPAAYTAMLKTVSAAIKTADPSAEVVSAAISQSNIGIPMLTFIQGMYNAGARGWFDSLAINPYAPAADQVLELVFSVRNLANGNGDTVPLRVTELGWATGGPPSPFRVSYEGQADLIKRTWATLVKYRALLALRGLIYFSWRDIPPYLAPFQDYFGLHTGLLELDGRTKPGLFAFGEAVLSMSEP